jgi:uncharacterized protein (TIGR03435 family)
MIASMNPKSRLSILLLLAAPIAFAQSPTPPAADPDRTCAALDPAADPTHGISFETVSVRPVEEQHNGRLINPPNGDGITSENGTLDDLVRWDFDLTNGWVQDQFQGLRKGFATDNYDIRAKVADSDVAAWQKLDDTARRLVFRKILFDRFHLACHFVYEERPVFNLVVAKSGLKMSQSKPEDLKPFDGKGYFPPQTFGVKVYMLGGLRYGFPEISMKLFAANFLSRQSGRIALDRTGLPGVYTFTLNFVGVYQNASAPGDDGAASEPTAPSLFTALEEQIGLKLEPAKGPVPIFVIDHIEKPSEN